MKILITIVSLFASLNAMAASYKVNEDIFLSGNQAKSLYNRLYQTPVVKTGQGELMKSLRTQEGSIIECIVSEEETNCTIKIKGAVLDQ